MFFFLFIKYLIYSGWKENKKSISPSLFGILKLNSKIKKKKKLILKYTNKINKGEDITIIGSPFGIISKLNFKNNFSKGIISNIIGKSKNHFIITDGRILPGNEGGGIFNKNEELISITTIPLKRNDISIEFNLGICLFDLFFDDLKFFLNFNQNFNFSFHLQQQQLYPSTITTTTKIFEKEEEKIRFKNTKNSLALIHISYSWASGIVISEDGCKKYTSNYIYPIIF